MLNLDNTKVAFLDFDDTLCIHLSHLRNYDDWFKAQITDDKEYYLDKDKFAPSLGMRSLIKELEKRDIPLYGLTMTDYGTVEPLKLAFVHHYYGTHMKKMVCTSSKENKITFIKRYCEQFNISKMQNVLLVDNNTDTIHMAMAEEIDIRTPQEIAVYYAREDILAELKDRLS